VVDELDLRAWLLQQGLPLPRTADPETFRKFSFDARWRAEVGQLVLHDLDMEVDETGISGNIQRVRTGHPRFGFELVADRLDLDRYFPAVGNAKEKPQKKPPQEPGQHASTAKSAVLQREAVDETPTASGANVPSSAMSATVVGPAMPELALGTLGNSDLAGRLRVGELHLAALRFGDADLRIRAKDGSLDIDNLVARFYEGMLKGKLALNLGGMEPKIALDQRAEGVQFGSLFADLNWSDRLSGRGEISANLTATGLSEDALRRSLDGNVAISIPQGAIMGVNLERLVREAEARLRGRSAPTNLPMQTDFRDLRASGDVKNGVLSNHDLIASADHLRITGAGILDLTKERIDYRFDPMFVKPPQGRGIKELEGIPIPVHLTGPFNQPLWEVDISDALRAAAKRRLDDQGGDLFKGLDERTGIKGLEKGLKNLFGR
jgi:AsmA protein